MNEEVIDKLSEIDNEFWNTKYWISTYLYDEQRATINTLAQTENSIWKDWIYTHVKTLLDFLEWKQNIELQAKRLLYSLFFFWVRNESNKEELSMMLDNNSIKFLTTLVEILKSHWFVIEEKITSLYDRENDKYSKKHSFTYRWFRTMQKELDLIKEIFTRKRKN